jgi:hypothetical protein
MLRFNVMISIQWRNRDITLVADSSLVFTRLRRNLTYEYHQPSRKNIYPEIAA